MKKTKMQKGITLVALIITIIVLLILAMIAIQAVTGSGIFGHARRAKDEYARTSEEENGILKGYGSYINGQLGIEEDIDEGTSYDGMYNLAGLEGKIAPTDLFDYEPIEGTGQTAALDNSSLPQKEIRITRIKPEYCNGGGYNPETEKYDLANTNYEVIYKGEKLADGLLVIPYQVEYEGELYKITEVDLYALGNKDYATRGNVPQGINILVFPNTIKRASSYQCITKIVFSNQMTDIMAGVCTSLTHLIVSEEVKNIEGLEYGSNMLARIQVDANNKNYSSEDGVLFNKDKTLLIRYPKAKKATQYTIPDSVTSISSYAFSGCGGLTNVTIPNGVTSIGDYAFSGSGVTNVTIPNGVTSIGGYVFSGCRGLTNVTIPNSVTSIGGRAFEDCSGLTNVTIPDSVTSIGWSAFEDCSRLTSVTIPNSVTSIGSSAFSGCNALTNITISNSVKNIENFVFEDCSGLTSVTIPSSVTSIGSSAFSGCSALTNITIPNSVTNIGSFAFYDCSALTNVTIPNSVTNIGRSAFSGCGALTNITIPNSVTSIESSVFYNCSALESINVDDNNSKYTSVDGILFNKTKTILICYPMKKTGTEYSIPDGLETIGDSSFSGCSALTKITIPTTVKLIETYAFSNCNALETIIYMGTSAQWRSSAIVTKNNWLGYGEGKAPVKQVICSDGTITL